MPSRVVVAVLACLLVAGCSTSVDGAPAAVPSSSTATPMESPPAEFDACSLPEELLSTLGLSGVSPVPIVGASGCLWAGKAFAVGVSLVEDTSHIEDVGSLPDVTALEVVPFGDYTTYLYIIDEDTSVTQTMTERGALMLTAIDIHSDGIEADRRISRDTFFAFAPYLPPPR
nr:DUF3558 family protein [Rhodococcus sp. (in: high G+C Gram-positive bacteria)]